MINLKKVNSELHKKLFLWAADKFVSLFNFSGMNALDSLAQVMGECWLNLLI